MTLHPVFCSLLAIAQLCLGHAMAQCTPQWLPGDGVPGVSHQVSAMIRWDPDGSGPLGPRVVVAGAFYLAGNAAANRIATYDPATGEWAALGAGMNGTVVALAVLPNGDLIAGGGFQSAGGVTAYGIARWNGSAWSAFGGSSSSVGGSPIVTALGVLPNGDLVAGGTFTAIGGVPANRVARWNGSTWVTFGSGADGAIAALAVMPNGDLVVGGDFATVGGLAIPRIARWNGSAWSAMGGGADAYVGALTVLPNGDLAACGLFGSIGGIAANRVARWNGTSWSTFGAGAPPTPNGSSVTDVDVLASGEVVATGTFLFQNSAWSPCVARWDGSNWLPISGAVTGGPGPLHVLPNGDLLVGGSFTAISGVVATNLARWNGSAWSALAPGFNGPIYAAAVLPGGDVVVGGQFTTAGAGPANRVARWNGSVWSPLGSGFDAAVNAIATLPNGDVVVGGAFLVAGSTSVSRIARWNGSAWSPLGSGIVGTVNALAVLPNGDLVAAGSFSTAGGLAADNIARWNGSAWSALGTGLDSLASALAVLPNGDLVVGGWFANAGGVAANRIARWNGTTWSALGTGMSSSLGLSVRSLAVLGDGSLVAGGAFSNAGGVSVSNIARWNGSAWSALGTGLGGNVEALAVLPGGDLVGGGLFTLAGSATVNRMARWNGSAWSALGAGLTPPNAGIGVRALGVRANGELVVGGGFLVAGSQGSANFARYATPCPATAVAAGTACVSSGGANTLTAVTLPWTNAPYRTRGTGLPSTAIVAVVNGFSTTSLPLAAVLPPSPAGCSLLVSPDVVDALVTTTGTVDAQLTLPNNPALAGTALHQQLVALQLDALGNLVQNTSTNRLTATIGAF